MKYNGYFISYMDVEGNTALHTAQTLDDLKDLIRDLYNGGSIGTMNGESVEIAFCDFTLSATFCHLNNSNEDLRRRVVAQLEYNRDGIHFLLGKLNDVDFYDLICNLKEERYYPADGCRNADTEKRYNSEWRKA